MPEEIVKLQNVRLSFPALWKPKAFEAGQIPKYHASFILDPEDNAADIARVRKALANVAKQEWPTGVPKSVKSCLRDGNEKEYAGYEGKLFLNASNSARPRVVDRANRPLTEEDGVLYSGCFVNASIAIWSQNNNFGKRLNASLRGVQFVADGERFGGGGVASEDEFDVLEPAGDFDDDDSAPY